jgi:hypothetical protein
MITELLTVKTRLSIPQFETDEDTIIENFIKLMTARFDLECDRKLERQASAEFCFDGSTTSILVDRYPLESVTSFWLKENETDGWVEQTGVEHLISPSKCLLTLQTPLGYAGTVGKIIFDGGYVMPGITATAGQTELPDDLEQAAVEQVAYLYSNSARIGIVSAGGGAGAVDLLREMRLLPEGDTVADGNIWLKFMQIDLLPQVINVLNRYKRMVW